MKRKRADLQNDEMKCNCQVHGRVSVGVCWGVGGGGLGGNRGPEGALLCLSMRQSLLKDANIFSRWLTAHRVVRSETFRQTCFSLCVFFFYICLSRTLSGEQSSLCWPSTRSENRSNHLFIDWNIRRLRGSEGAAATKSGKDRLAGGIREGGEGEGGGEEWRWWREWEWNWVRNKDGETTVERTKRGQFAFIRRHHNRQIRDSRAMGKEQRGVIPVLTPSDGDGCNLKRNASQPMKTFWSSHHLVTAAEAGESEVLFTS